MSGCLPPPCQPIHLLGSGTAFWAEPRTSEKKHFWPRMLLPVAHLLVQVLPTRMNLIWGSCGAQGTSSESRDQIWQRYVRHRFSLGFTLCSSLQYKREGPTLPAPPGNLVLQSALGSLSSGSSPPLFSASGFSAHLQTLPLTVHQIFLYNIPGFTRVSGPAHRPT